jgi:Ser-tRNA(Ala) deacylase AlaX
MNKAKLQKTRKIFWEDPYAAGTETTVVSVDGDTVTVDRTVAFAYPGGQLPDSGTIGGKPILDGNYDQGRIYYTLPPDHGLAVGDTVPMLIDWERRYVFMRLHFAAELAIVVLANRYGRHKLTLAKILEDKAVLEYQWDGDISETFPVLEGELRDLVAANHWIISEYSDREQEKRYWEIPGIVKVSCGGTHLKRTGEIGGLILRHTRPAPGTEGLEIFLA